jgi:hypothetical protein
MKSEYEILICDETVFMKWPLIGFVTFNPENEVLLLADPLIVNHVHVDVVTDTAAELVPILFSMN